MEAEKLPSPIPLTSHPLNDENGRGSSVQSEVAHQMRRFFSMGSSEGLKQRSRELRCSATAYENHLWYDFLRTYPLQFYRQRVMGGYIVDFYCPKAKLVIELDGSQHLQPDAVIYDDARTKYLNARGLCVLRFSNHMIDQQFRFVCQTIAQAAVPHSQNRQAKLPHQP